MKNVLVTSKEYARNTRDYVQKIIDKYDYNVIYSEKSPMDEEALISAINENDAEGLLVYSSSDKVTDRVISSCPSLKVISRHGVGIENIDSQSAKRNNVKIVNTRNAHDYEDIADLVFGLILNVAKELYKFNDQLKNGVWNRVLKPGVWGKTIGIIGYGRIGRTVAKRAAGFNMNILVFDPYIKESDLENSNIRLVGFDTLLCESDFVSLHCVVTEQTRKMIGKTELEKMKKTAYLINSARAALVDIDALIDALKEGVIAGAATDVFDAEPATDDALVKSGAENLFVTPHIGIYTCEVLREIDELAMDNMLSNL